MKKSLFLFLCLTSLSAFASSAAPGKNVDILFVIDNSGSMQTIQENIIKNTKVFFEQFAKQPYINWKIGMISTDRQDKTILGFETSFDWSMIDFRDPEAIADAVSIFQEAVSKLGTYGDGEEFVFYNVSRVLNANPTFLRANADLAVVMISDEEEQSKKYGSEYSAVPFLATLSKQKASDKKIRFYGALSSRDLAGCNANVISSVYTGGEFEAIIKLTNGFNVSACSSDFGIELSKIGKDIASITP